MELSQLQNQEETHKHVGKLLIWLSQQQHVLQKLALKLPDHSMLQMLSVIHFLLDVSGMEIQLEVVLIHLLHAPLILEFYHNAIPFKNKAKYVQKYPDSVEL